MGESSFFRSVNTTSSNSGDIIINACLSHSHQLDPEHIKLTNLDLHQLQANENEILYGIYCLQSRIGLMELYLGEIPAREFRVISKVRVEIIHLKHKLTDLFIRLGKSTQLCLSKEFENWKKREHSTHSEHQNPNH